MFDPYSLLRFSILQIEEIMSDENRHFAREKLGHEPCIREMCAHWVQNTVGYQIAHFEIGVPEMFRRGK